MRTAPLLCLLILLPGAKAHAIGERSLWIFEQLAEPPRPTEATQSRSQVSLGLENYMDAISLAARRGGRSPPLLKSFSAYRRGFS